MMNTILKVLALCALMAGSGSLVSAQSAPAPSRGSCPPCLCDTPPASIIQMNTTTIKDVPAFHCNNPGTSGYTLAQTCNTGSFVGQALLCNPTPTIGTGLGFLAATYEVGAVCTSDSDCQEGTFCSSASPRSAMSVCTFIATAECFTECNACICNPYGITPAPAPAPGRKMK